MSLQAGDYLAPALEHAAVSDVMRSGVFACAADTPLVGVARIMATNHVHSVIVVGGEPEGERAWGLVSDLDLVKCARHAETLTAGEAASFTTPTVAPATALREAADLMAERAVTHLIVANPESGEPLGVVSTLDVAGNVAWARG